MGQDWSSRQDEESRQSSRSLMLQQPQPAVGGELKQERKEAGEERNRGLEEHVRVTTAENWW